MDGREGMALSGSASYYLNRGGISGVGSASGSGVGGGGGGSGVPTTPGFKSFSNSNISIQSNVGGGGGGAPMGGGSTFQVVENNPSPGFRHGISISPSMPSSGSPGSDPGKKKRGRPRKYASEGSNMSLGLSPMSSMPSPGSNTPGGGPKKGRGRPPGSGWKQRLAPLGEWMNATAGLAFTPHVMHIGVGEDIAAKLLSFAQHRPRALCILSANGSVSAVTLRQPTTTGGTVTYEGHFEILCLSGSYLLAETGGPKNRTGGISISVCSPDGHVIGGAIGGRLIASSPVQVVVCSFVYGGTKAKGKAETTNIKEEKTSTPKSAKKLDQKPLIITPVSAVSSQDHPTPHSTTSSWPPPPRTDMRNPQMEFDLTRG